MVATAFKLIQRAAVLKADPLASDQALALASAPGGCAGNRYPLFIELENVAGFQPGGFCSVEFILPGKPGRWRASGEILAAVDGQHSSGSAKVPSGLGIELLGLALTGESFVQSNESAQASPPLAETVPPSKAAVSAPAVDEHEALFSFDASEMTIEVTDVVAMLRDLLGRDVKGQTSSVLVDKIAPNDVVASYRDDHGDVVFAIAFDKAGAARIGSALTMLPENGLEAIIEASGALGGEPLDNAKEVLNIMSALFHEADAPHVVLAETVTGKALAETPGGPIQAVFDNQVWSLSLSVDIEDYGKAEIYLVAK